MKVSPPKEVTKTINKILLPLVDDPEESVLTKGDSVSFDPRTAPNDGASPKCKCLARVLEGTEAARTVLKWRTDVTKVCTGLNVTDCAPKKAVVETMMRTGPLALFRNCLEAEARNAFHEVWQAAAPRDPANPQANDRDGVREAGLGPHRHANHIETALNFVVQQMLPHKVLARVKRNLRREMRKPAGMKVRAYYQALLRINLEEITLLPPFGNNQRLSDDELLDVILCGTPKTWQREMERQGFDPLVHPLSAVIDFLENIESADDFDGTKVESKKKTTNSKSKDKGTNSFYCLIHGKNKTHNTDDCNKMNEKCSHPLTCRLPMG